MAIVVVALNILREGIHWAGCSGQLATIQLLPMDVQAHFDDSKDLM